MAMSLPGRLTQVRQHKAYSDLFSVQPKMRVRDNWEWLYMILQYVPYHGEVLTDTWREDEKKKKISNCGVLWVWKYCKEKWKTQSVFLIVLTE